MMSIFEEIGKAFVRVGSGISLLGLKTNMLDGLKNGNLFSHSSEG